MTKSHVSEKYFTNDFQLRHNICIFVKDLKKENMKKLIGLGVIALTLFACKPTNDVKSQIGLKGNWTLTRVSYPSGYKVTSFSIADAKCLEGSQWKFVSNNNTGTMQLNAGENCPSFSSNIVWTIGVDRSFNLKFIGDEKAKHVKDGYRLDIENQTESSFQLVDRSTEANIVYQFQKN